MNKQISKNDFNQVQSSIITSITVGSHSYGITNERSDRDILHVYKSDSNEEGFHQSIYQETGVDHLLCTLKQLVNNIVSGDSLVNFEAIHSEEAKTALPFIYENRQEFYTFNVIKAYLGFAKRDLKNFYSTINMDKLFHAYRGVLVAQRLLNEQTYSNDHKTFSEQEQSNLIKIKANKLERGEITKLAGDVSLRIEALKKEMTTKLNSHQLKQTIGSEFKAKLEAYNP